MKTTVYIPSFNAAGTLPRVIEGILAQTLRPDEILVVDDGSTDATPKIVTRYAGRGVQLLRQDRNRGLGAARNRALAAADGELLVGLDADVRPEPDYLNNAVNCFERHPDVGAICGRLLEQYTETPADQWRSVHMNQDGGIESSRDPRFLYGCTTSIRRDVARQVCGWNERFTRSYEDVDLTRRLRQAGIGVRYEASCVAHHLKRDTIDSVLTAFWRWFFPCGDLAGSFDSMQAWIDARIEKVPWSLFRHRFAEDLAQRRDVLLPLTLLMPWWMTDLDLKELARRHASHAAETDAIRHALPDLAREVFQHCGAPNECSRWVAEWLARTDSRGGGWEKGISLQRRYAGTRYPSRPSSERHSHATAHRLPQSAGRDSRKSGCEKGFSHQLDGFSQQVERTSHQAAIDRILETAIASIGTDRACWRRAAASLTRNSDA